MKSILEFLPEIVSVEESPIEIKGQIEAWHVVLFDQEKNALCGGFRELKATARRIAIAEAAGNSLIFFFSNLTAHAYIAITFKIRKTTI